MESERWCPPSSSVALCGEGSEKEQWPLPALLSVRKMPPSCHPYARQLRSSLYVSDTFQSAALALELIGSETKFVHRSFKRNCLGLQQFFCLPQPLSPHDSVRFLVCGRAGGTWGRVASEITEIHHVEPAPHDPS